MRDDRDRTPEQEARQMSRRCNRCREDVDDDAYSQMEWVRFGGERVQARAYYCDRCKRVLRSVGQGEVTDLEARAEHTPSAEEAYKADY